MTTEAQKRATAKWRKGNVKQWNLALYPGDADIAEWLDKQPVKQAAVKAAIRAYMAQDGTEVQDGEDRAL